MPHAAACQIPVSARLALHRLAIACLVIGLLLQSVSSIVAGVLGGRHAHATPAQSQSAQDPMAGWKDFRRAQYDHLPPSAAHAHAHEIGARHHHVAGDPGVLRLEAPGEGVAGEVLQGANFVFAPALGLGPMPPPVETSGDAWRMSSPQPFRSADLRRFERPPRRA